MRWIHLTSALVVIAAMMAPATLYGSGRDSDGSRMQARPIALGSSNNDRLSPPADPVDWRYVRLANAHNLRVSVTTQPASATATVTLTDAMGKSLVRGQTSGGTFETRRQLDPGLYYIAVAASRPLQYTISVQ